MSKESKATFDLTEFFKSNNMELKDNDVSFIKHHYLVGTVHAAGTEVRYIYYVFLKESGALPVQLKKNLVISPQTSRNCVDFLPPFIVSHSENDEGELEVSFFDVFTGNRITQRNVISAKGVSTMHGIEQMALGPNFLALCSPTRLYLYFHCHFTRLPQLTSPSAVLSLPFGALPVLSLSLHSPSLTLLAASAAQAVVFDLVNLRALASLPPPPGHAFSELLVVESTVFALLAGRAALLCARLLAPHEARARASSSPSSLSASTLSSSSTSPSMSTSPSTSSSTAAAGATTVTVAPGASVASLLYPLPLRATAMRAHEDRVAVTFATGLSLLFEPRAAAPLARAARAPQPPPPPLFASAALFPGERTDAGAGDPMGSLASSSSSAAAGGGGGGGTGGSSAAAAAPSSPAAASGGGGGAASSLPAYAAAPSAALSALFAREPLLDCAAFLRVLDAHAALDAATGAALESKSRISFAANGPLAPLAQPALFAADRSAFARALPPALAAGALFCATALPLQAQTLAAVGFLTHHGAQDAAYAGLGVAGGSGIGGWNKPSKGGKVWKAKGCARVAAAFPLRGGGVRLCLLHSKGTRAAAFRDAAWGGEDDAAPARREEPAEAWDAAAPPPALLYAAQSPLPGPAVFSPARMAEDGGGDHAGTSGSSGNSFADGGGGADGLTSDVPTRHDPPVWEALLATPRWGLRVRWALLAVMEVIRLLLSSHKVQTELTAEMAPTLVSFYCAARDVLFLWLLAPDTLRVSHPEAVDYVLVTLRDLGRRLGASARAGGMKRLLGSVNLKGRIEVLNGRLFAGVRRFKDGLELTPLAHELLALRRDGPKELTKRLRELYVAKKRVGGSRIRGGTGAPQPPPAGRKPTLTDAAAAAAAAAGATSVASSAGASSSPTSSAYEPPRPQALAPTLPQGMDLLGLNAWEMWYGATPMTEWDEFIAAMQEELGLQISEEEEEAMSSVLDSSGTRLVTQVKFMEWLKGFGPLREAPRNTLHLLSQPYFKSYLTRTEAQWLLAAEAEGTYLVRFSESSPGAFTLAFVYNGSVLQTQIKYNEESTDLRQRFRVPVQGTFRFFASVDEILHNFSRLLKIPFVSQLLEKPWFLGDVTRTECEEMLAGKPVGAFLVRFSAQTVGGLAISYVGKPHEVAHASVQKMNDGTFVVGGRPPAFRSMEEILKAYEAVLKFPYKDVERAESEDDDYAVF